MSVDRTRTNFRVREDFSRNITPKVTVQDNIVSPAGEWVPAPWLPIAFTKTDVSRGTSPFVISAGKLVSLERSPYGSGRRPHFVPSGLRLLFGGTGTASITSSTVLTYTSLDVSEKVIDLTTGVAVSAPAAYTALQVAKAIVERGLVSAKAVLAVSGSAVPPTTITHVSKIIDLFISEPVGIVPYDVYSYAGFIEEGDQRFTNWREQAALSYQTQGQLRLPWRTTAEKTNDTFDVSALTGSSYNAGDQVAAGELWEIAALRQIGRYSFLAANAPVVALGLNKQAVATVTDRTAITCNIDTVLVSQKTSPADIADEGDWAIDYDLGTIFIHADVYDTLVTDNTDPTFSYFYYGTGGNGAIAHRYALFEGDAVPGGFVSYDVQSNFYMVADTSVSTNMHKIVGRVVDFEVHPKHLKQYVKSPWATVNGLTAKSMMPGTATKGFPDAFTLPELDQNIVADRYVIITLNCH